MAQRIRAAALLSMVFLLTGCAASGTEGLWGILTGVMAWSRQDWALSASAFLETAARADAAGDTALRDYAVFGLASTYLVQDEYDSALSRLSEIGESASPDIRSGVWYQAGIIAFRKGEYGDSADFFRKSLENDPTRLDAKINLELSRRSLVESRADRATGASGIRDDGDGAQDTEAIFNLVRKKEQDRWKNQADESSNTSVADY